MIATLVAASVALGSASCGGGPATPTHTAPTRTALWVSRHNGRPAVYPKGEDSANSLVVSADGTRVFVTGESERGTPTGRDAFEIAPDYVTVAYDATTGVELWVARYNGQADGRDKAYAIGLSPDGTKVFVTGRSDSVGTTDYATVAYRAASGKQLWVARYDGSSSARSTDPTSLAVSSDGTRVFVTGSGDSYEYATVAYDASTGSQLWVARHRGAGQGCGRFVFHTSVVVSRDGAKLFVTGTCAEEYSTVAYDAASGERLWTASYGGEGCSVGAVPLVLSGDGKRLVVSGGCNGDYATVAYEAANGAQLWVARYDSPENLYDEASSLVLSGDGEMVFVTGVSLRFRSCQQEYVTVAYAIRTGARLWVDRSAGPGCGDGKPILAVDGPTLFVAGAVWSGANDWTDYGTVAYKAATGAKKWLARYGYRRSDRPNGIAVGGGKVFVTGRSWDSTNGWAYATVAYAALR